MEVAVSSPSRPAACHVATATTATRLRQTRLFDDYRNAFEGATGLALGLIETPPFMERAASRPITRTQRCSTSFADRHSVMVSYIPILFGDTIAACLQLGPFAWSTDDDTEGNPQRSFRRKRCAIRRSEHRSILRLLGLFALQLAEASDGLMLGQLSDEPSFVESARAYIAAHLTEDLALTTVATAVNISPFYFCKRFHESTGLHFTEYVPCGLGNDAGTGSRRLW